MTERRRNEPTAQNVLAFVKDAKWDDVLRSVNERLGTDFETHWDDARINVAELVRKDFHASALKARVTGDVVWEVGTVDSVTWFVRAPRGLEGKWTFAYWSIRDSDYITAVTNNTVRSTGDTDPLRLELDGLGDIEWAEVPDQ